MALAERVMNAEFGDGVVNHYTYVFMGDGCLMEGISQEAISMAGHLKLGRLIAFFDDNSISIDGATSLAVSDDEVARHPMFRISRGERAGRAVLAGSAWHPPRVRPVVSLGDRFEPQKVLTAEGEVTERRTRVGQGDLYLPGGTVSRTSSGRVGKGEI